MARTDPHFRLRLPAELRDLLQQIAERNRRSVNAEIVERLERSLAEGVSDAEAKAAALEREAAAARASFHAAEANLRSLEGQLGEAMERVRAWNSEQARIYRESTGQPERQSSASGRGKRAAKAD